MPGPCSPVRAHDRWARGHGQSRATAALTAWTVGLTAGSEPGVHHLHHLVALADLPHGLGIALGGSR
ncbi:hypothetical protein [Nocardiopsis quinghaiensis]|uniref:hypothetical protein n=1 Tax=Nocardiopsis quinghaiensis TaxID=464995 RepID=UPI0016817AD3|nr:hypothetical protein [Nocardiopsis quinghaiensis]